MRAIAWLALPLAFSGQAVLAHGGDSHDVNSVHLLRGKILDDHEDEHEHRHSRFSLGVTANSSQTLGDDKSKPSPEPSNLNEKRLGVALNYRVSPEASLNLLGGFSSAEALQDPSFGSTYVRAITREGIQSVSFAAIAVPASKISREQSRVLTMNLSSGLLTMAGRWTAGLFGNLGLPFYGGTGRKKSGTESEQEEDASHHEGGSHDDGHSHIAERFLAGGSLRLAYRLVWGFRLDTSFEAAAKRLTTSVTVFDSELTLAKICFLGANWEAGLGLGWKEENGSSFQFPASAISKFTVIFWR